MQEVNQVRLKSFECTKLGPFTFFTYQNGPHLSFSNIQLREIRFLHRKKSHKIALWLTKHLHMITNSDVTSLKAQLLLMTDKSPVMHIILR